MWVSASPLITNLLAYVFNDRTNKGLWIPYAPQLQQIILAALTELSTDARVSPAGQSLFVQQLAIGNDDLAWEEPGQKLLWNNNGVVVLTTTAQGYSLSPVSLVAGQLWNNGGVLSVIPGISIVPTAPTFFAAVSAAELLNLTGAALPTTAPLKGSGIVWNDGGVVSVA